MESMQAAGAESRELAKDDIADDQQAEASNFPPVEVKEDEENPWLHLSKQFAFKRKRGNSYIILCKLYLPSQTELSAYKNSSSFIHQGS